MPMPHSQSVAGVGNMYPPAQGGQYAQQPQPSLAGNYPQNMYTNNVAAFSQPGIGPGSSQQYGQQLGPPQTYNQQPGSSQPYGQFVNPAQQQSSGSNPFGVNYQPGNPAGVYPGPGSGQFGQPNFGTNFSVSTSNNGPSNSGYVYQQPGQSNVGQTVGNTVYSNGPNQGYGYLSQPSQSQGPSGPSAGYQGQVGPEQRRHMHDAGQTTGNGAGDGGYRGPGQSAVPATQPPHLSGFQQQLLQATVSNDAYIVKPPVLARGKNFQFLLLFYYILVYIHSIQAVPFNMLICTMIS